MNLTNLFFVCRSVDVCAYFFAGPFSKRSSELYTKPFTHLASKPNVRRLEKASELDDGIDTVQLNIPIKWFLNTDVKEVGVTSNGQIRIHDCPMECSECGSIDVAYADLDPSHKGDVWFLNNARNATSFPNQAMYIISWEGVPFARNFDSYLYAQAHFYINSTIELCWGNINTIGHSFRAGLFDPQYNEKIPAWGEPFEPDGYTKGAEYHPFLECQLYFFDALASSAPSLPPTEAPTGASLNNGTCKDNPDFTHLDGYPATTCDWFAQSPDYYCYMYGGVTATNGNWSDADGNIANEASLSHFLPFEMKRLLNMKNFGLKQISYTAIFLPLSSPRLVVRAAEDVRMIQTSHILMVIVGQLVIGLQQTTLTVPIMGIGKIWTAILQMKNAVLVAVAL